MTNDPITRLNAALEGRYLLERELGEGGMATVYLADDLKHERKVALKVLKPELAAVVGAERFLAEIKTTANLQHPHILPLFDSGEADTFLFYVMPFVEGETLRERIDRDRQLPVEDAVRFATAVANALQHAHDRGVIHRDIKPANILLQDGEPVVADFGMALAVGAAGGARLTETGLSVGTPYYMSPEQATGDQGVGPASDTYALACVLYEMLVGEPPYPGATAQAVLGKIIAGEAVSATKQRPAIPANVDAAIRRALEKISADRFSSAQDFAKALADPGFTHGTPAGAGAGGPAGGSGIWKGAAIVLGISTLVLAVMTLSGGSEEPAAGVLRYELLLPVEVGANSDFGSNVAISPDGRRIVYSGMEEGAESPGLWVRDRDQLQPFELDGTTLGFYPTFSPDGTQVAFIGDDRTLKVVSLSGRPPVTLHRGPELRRGGLSWGDDGFIYFSEGAREGGPYTLRRILETGGDAEFITSADSLRSEVAHYFPDVLPGSELVLFSIAREDEYDAEKRDIAVASIATGEVHVLLQGMQAVWSESGHILAVRGDGALVSATFNPATLELGPATPIFEGVQVESLASADFAISENGTLIYAPGAAIDGRGGVPVWVDRSGTPTTVDPNWSGRFADPKISPDGLRVAVSVTEGEAHIWVKELDAGPQTKLTFQGRINVRPTWTPDGSTLAFVSNRGGNRDVYQRRADAATPAEEVLGVAGVVQGVEYSPDGEWTVFRIGEDLHLRASAAGSELTPLIAGPGVAEVSPTISPDGRWIAYVSDESGERMVYVRPFPEVSGGKFTVSLGSAEAPRWAPDGSELYYRSAGGEFMAAEVVPSSTFILGERTALFPLGGISSNASYPQYDVHPDGDRFLMIQLGDPSGTSALVVIENFMEELYSAGGG